MKTALHVILYIGNRKNVFSFLIFSTFLSNFFPCTVNLHLVEGFCVAGICRKEKKMMIGFRNSPE